MTHLNIRFVTWLILNWCTTDDAWHDSFTDCAHSISLWINVTSVFSMENVFFGWLFNMCDMTHSPQWCVTLPHLSSNQYHVSLLRGECVLRLTLAYVWHDTCDMTPSPQWSGTWLHLFSQLNPCRSSPWGMCHIRTQLIHMCDMTCETWLHLCSISARNQIHVDLLRGERVPRVTHSHAWYDAFATRIRAMITSLIAINFLPIFSAGNVFYE